MRNLKFVRYSAVLLGLVVLRTKARNRFCPMCTKGCYTVLNRSKPFWGQFWGQICETDSHTHRSYKYAALISLRNTNINITRFSHRKMPNEPIYKFYSPTRSCTKVPRHSSPTHRPCHREKRPCLGAFAKRRHRCPPGHIPPQNSLPLGLFLQERLFLRRLCPDGFHLYRKSLH